MQTGPNIEFSCNLLSRRLLQEDSSPLLCCGPWPELALTSTTNNTSSTLPTYTWLTTSTPPLALPSTTFHRLLHILIHTILNPLLTLPHKKQLRELT